MGDYLLCGPTGRPPVVLRFLGRNRGGIPPVLTCCHPSALGLGRDPAAERDAGRSDFPGRGAFVRAALTAGVDSVEVSTVVYLPPAAVYEGVVDFPRYEEYSRYLERVERDGDGGPGTRYALDFAWWRLTYTAHAAVTDADPPNRLDWRVTEDVDAAGHWSVEAAPEVAPVDAETASRVRLRVGFDPDSAGGVDLPAFVSAGWVVEKVTPLIRDEAERVVERLVADLEGERRPVELTVHATPDAV